MSTITTRAGKGSPLTNNEVDANFTNLNTDKAELSGAAFTGAITTTSTVDGVDIATRDAVLTSTTTTANAALPKSGGAMTGAITTNSTFDGRDVATDGTKLDGIESGATADQTAAQIKTAYESNSDTNAFTDADHTKLDGIEASADVTDAINVAAAGGLMDSELTSEASVKALNQGVATTDSPTFAGLTTSADISFGDSDKAIFGAGSDLQIYHDGTSNDSIIDEAGTGNLNLQGTNVVIKTSGGSATQAEFFAGDANRFYYNNVLKLATTSTGIDVTGTVTADKLVSDSNVDAASFTSTGSTYVDINNGTVTGRLQTISSDFFIGTATTGTSLAFKSGNSVEAMRIDASGNVGIGTSSPADNLDISLNNNTGGLVGVQIHNTNTGTVANFAGIITTAVNGTVGMRVQAASVAGLSAATFGSTTSHPARFVTADTERMRIDSSGNVGIGTSSLTGGNTILNLSRTGSGAGCNMQFANSHNNAFYVGLAGDTSGDAILHNANEVSGMAFGTNNTERMRIDSSGNVQIGTGTPAYLVGTSDIAQLSVNRVGTSGAITNASRSAAFINVNGADGGSSIEFSTASANNTQPSERMRIDGAGNVGIGETNPKAPGGSDARSLTLKGISYPQIITVATGATANSTTWRSISRNTHVYQIQTVNDAVTDEQTAYEISRGSGLLSISYQRWYAGTTEAMRIDSSGNLMVGKTSSDDGVVGLRVSSLGVITSTIASPSANTYRMYSAGYKFYVNTNGGISNLSANNINLSDEREKKNIENLESQWDSLKQWSLKKFHYNADDDSDNKKLGVIAQEVETHNPEVIDEFNVDDDTTRMAVKEQQMMWMAIKALQEAQTRIETLEARVTELENN